MTYPSSWKDWLREYIWGVRTRTMTYSCPQLDWLPSHLGSVDSRRTIFLSTKTAWLPSYPGSADSESDIFLSATGLTPQLPGECGLGNWYVPIHEKKMIFTPQVSGKCELGKKHIPNHKQIDSPVTRGVRTWKVTYSYPQLDWLPSYLESVDSEIGMFLSTKKQKRWLTRN